MKSVLRALERDLERVALMAVGEIRFVYCQAVPQLAEFIMRSHLLTLVLFNATRVGSNAQIVLMTLNFSFWLQVFNRRSSKSI